MNRRLFGLGVIALLSGALVMGTAGASSYGVNPAGTLGIVGSTGGGPNGRTVTAHQMFKVVTGNNNSLKILHTCDAAGSPNPTSTFVHCYLRGRTDRLKYDERLHGEALNATVVTSLVSVPPQAYDICVQGWSYFRDGSLVTSGPEACR